MNVNTGELRMLTEDQMQELSDHFTRVPDELQADAIKTLNGEKSANVDLRENSPLANWARRERHKAKSNRAKMVKASKRRNRG